MTLVRILLSRTRIGLVQPSYAYRLFVPMCELSAERQSLIAMRSDYGHGQGLLATLADVIAPMAHLEANPGLEKFRFAADLNKVAGRAGALLLNAALPEMLERTTPFRLLVPFAPSDALRVAQTVHLAGRYRWLEHKIETLRAADLGWRRESDR